MGAICCLSYQLSSLPSADLLAEAGFHVGERGSNTWLVVPDDLGVLDGAIVNDGVRCVTPVQAYLDLKSQPERSQQAREELRRVHLDHRGELATPGGNINAG